MTEVSDVKPWPLRGYAPGGWMRRCSKCGKVFDGTCGALRCLECAVMETKDALTDALAARPNPWQAMACAPLDGRHVILAVKVTSGFVFSVQGAYQDGEWNCAIQGNVNPVAWMPNVPLPDHLCPWKAEALAALEGGQ